MTTRSSSGLKSRTDDKQATKSPMNGNIGGERKREEDKMADENMVDVGSVVSEEQGASVEKDETGQN